MSKIPCSVEILTRNSAATLERCLRSVSDFAEIIILDGNSTDATRRIAEKFGCKIYRQYDTEEPLVRIRDYSEVRNKGLRLSTFPWFMYIDSDEYLSSEAAEEIRSIVESKNPPAYVFWQPRKYVLDGDVIECATTYPNRQIRLFHKTWVTGFERPIHERIFLKEGTKAGTLRNFEYVPLDPLEELHGRWKRYMNVEVAMNAQKPPIRLIKHAFRRIVLFALYAIRYLSTLVFCRGMRLPFSYEWGRHQYELKLARFLFLQAIKNIRI